MHRDMFLLAERLVIAIETMSQDVKNMSAYIYDISCSVSYILNEKKEKEFISVVPCDEDDVIPCGTSAAGLEATDEMEYSRQYDQRDKRSSSYSGDPEHGESSFGDIAPINIDPHEISDIPSTEKKSIFPVGIKIEQQADDDVNEESCSTLNIHRKNRSTEGFWKELQCQEQSVTDGQDEAYGMKETISSHPEQSTPLETIELVSPASSLEGGEIQSLVSSSNTAPNSDSVATISEGHAVNPQVASVKDPTSLALKTVDLEAGPYKCLICETLFNDCSDLARHTKVHSGDSPLACSVCGKWFAYSSALARHMRSHTGEKPYKCNVCGKAFSQSSNRNLHMRSHSGEKPYKCDVCGKAFSKNVTLRVHMRIHTSENPYLCLSCGEAFRSPSAFTQHMQAHSAQQNPFQ